MVKYWIKNILDQCSSNLAPEMYITKDTKWHLWCCCHDNSFAAGPVLIKIEIPSFCLYQVLSTPSNLMRRVKTIREQCLFSARPSVALKRVGNGNIWFLSESDWGQESSHGKGTTGVILFRLWFILLLPRLKITAPIFLEIFLIQYLTILVVQSTTSSHL